MARALGWLRAIGMLGSSSNTPFLVKDDSQRRGFLDAIVEQHQQVFEEVRQALEKKHRDTAEVLRQVAKAKIVRNSATTCWSRKRTARSTGAITSSTSETSGVKHRET